MDTIISKLKATETSSNDTDTKKECFVYSSGNTTKKGYISFLISLAYKINTVIGGDPLRINDTLSREGSISFINRAAPFVAKEEITKFYGMEENELYEQVSNESDGDKKTSINTVNKPINANNTNLPQLDQIIIDNNTKDNNLSKASISETKPKFKNEFKNDAPLRSKNKRIDIINI